jgi:hypothetical protein
MALTDHVAKLLDRDVLEIQIALRYRDGMDHSEAKPEAFRFVAYRNKWKIFMILWAAIY